MASSIRSTSHLRHLRYLDAVASYVVRGASLRQALRTACDLDGMPEEHVGTYLADSGEVFRRVAYLRRTMPTGSPDGEA